MTLGVTVVLPAAGTGERMQSQVPKQFYPVLGLPMIVYTIKNFESMPLITEIIVPVSSDKMLYMRELKECHNLQKTRVIHGSNNRHGSILEGIRAIDKDRTDVVIVHDAVRPFAKKVLVTKVINAARTHGASGVMTKPTSSIVKIDACGVVETFRDRGNTRSVEQPQAFQYKYIRDTYEEATEEILNGWTSSLLLVMNHTGVRPMLIDGESENMFKVTYQKDLPTLDGMLKERHIEVEIINMCNDKQSTRLRTRIKGRAKECGLSVDIQSWNPRTRTPANTFVMINEKADTETIQRYTEGFLSKCRCNGSLVSTVVVHVVLNSGEEKTYPELASQVTQYACQLRNRNAHKTTLLYIVFAEGKEEDTVELVNNFLWNRTPAMIGPYRMT